MALEILIFFVQSDSYFNFVVDVFLRSVFNSHVAKFQRDLSVQNHARGISSSVHDIDFSDDTQSSGSFRIPLSCKMQSLRSAHISIGRDNSQDDRSIFLTISLSHFGSHLFDVIDLMTH